MQSCDTSCECFHDFSEQGNHIGVSLVLRHFESIVDALKWRFLISAVVYVILDVHDAVPLRHLTV